MAREKTESLVYVIGPMDGPIKVGFAKSVNHRLRSIQTGHPEKLIVHYTMAVRDEFVRLVEAQAHKRLASYRREGEWFATDIATAVRAIEASTKIRIKAGATRVPKIAPSRSRLVSDNTYSRTDEAVQTVHKHAELAKIEPSKTESREARKSQLVRRAERAMQLAEASLSEKTRATYEKHMRIFEKWCEKEGEIALPVSASTIIGYITECAGQLSVSSLNCRLSAIKAAHREACAAFPDDPLMDRVWHGFRKTHGSPPKKKRALTVDAIRKSCAAAPKTRKGVRDNALMLMGFAGGMRRSEIVGLVLDGPGIAADANRLEFVNEGIQVTLGKSKTDQEGHGRIIRIPHGKPATCPVQALREWLKIGGIAPGQVIFDVDPRTVARAVKRSAIRAKLDPAAFSAHSLRSGLASEAAKGGASHAEIANTTGHKSHAMVQSYIQDHQAWTNNAARKAGI